jgi:hypothetical protein
MKYVPPIQRMPPRAAYAIHPAILVHESMFRIQCGRRPLSASRTLTHKRVRHISQFLIACTMFPAEETIVAVIL